MNKVLGSVRLLHQKYICLLFNTPVRAGTQILLIQEDLNTVASYLGESCRS